MFIIDQSIGDTPGSQMSPAFFELMWRGYVEFDSTCVMLCF